MSRSKVTSKVIGTTFVQKLLLLVLSVLLSGYGRAEAATTKIFALTTNNKLLAIDSATPGTIISSVAISGLQSGETIVGIDFRPSSGQLYAIGNSSRVYTIDLSSGAATAIGNAPFAPPLSGADFGVDFNPVPDLIRVVSDGDQNLRVSPATGAVAGMDTPLAYDAGDINKDANPNIVAAAYTNNFFGTASTTLYDIDSNLNILVTQGGLNGTPSPNLGQLFTVGALGVDPTNLVGVDIASTGSAFAAMTLTGESASKLFRINLATGAATLIGTFGGTELIRDIAISVPPPPSVYAITTTNNLLNFSVSTPGTLLSNVAVTGLQSGESLVGIDFRPSTGQLYGVGSSNRVYVIDVASGQATSVSTSAFSPGLSGTEFGVDFNPVPDLIRVVSDADQNLRLSPGTGALAGTDTPLAYDASDVNKDANPNIVAAAYTNNFFGTTTTTLYDIDSNLDVLVTQGGTQWFSISQSRSAIYHRNSGG